MAEKIATRHAYGEALAEIGSDPKIVALDADVSSARCRACSRRSTRSAFSIWVSQRPI